MSWTRHGGRKCASENGCLLTTGLVEKILLSSMVYGKYFPPVDPADGFTHPLDLQVHAPARRCHPIHGDWLCRDGSIDNVAPRESACRRMERRSHAGCEMGIPWRRQSLTLINRV